ncbi:bifunctional molybdenum cofactor biosynthesis protein MoaC/MoaB, partial [Mesorhizobium sp. M2D.F.Ca.ET.160.01.1.1]
CWAPVPERQAIRGWCGCGSEGRTGVEMEALAGVNAALLTLYDLSKPVEPALSIEGIRLLFKEGGKRGVWLHPDGMDEAELARFKPRAPKGLEGAACAV